jgi:hypothetical protein
VATLLGPEAAESVAAEEWAETQVLPVNSPLRVQVPEGRSQADRMRPEAAALALVSLAYPEEVWERVLVQGLEAQVAAAVVDLGGEPARVAAQARMKSMGFWAR